jgi:cyclophilin family peptidyl-prolyl cis-trans isomerase
MSPSPGGKPLVTLETSLGLIRLELWPDVAPITVQNFLSYVQEGFYDGLLFHRVVPMFVVQGGGFEPGMVYRAPTHPTIKNEAAHDQKNLRGTIAMARAYPVDSAAAQFFFNLVDNPALDHISQDPREYGYAVFGQVTEGMQVAEMMSNRPRETRAGHQNVPQTDIVIQRAYVTIPKKSKEG